MVSFSFLSSPKNRFPLIFRERVREWEEEKGGGIGRGRWGETERERKKEGVISVREKH